MMRQIAANHARHGSRTSSAGGDAAGVDVGGGVRDPDHHGSPLTAGDGRGVLIADGGGVDQEVAADGGAVGGEEAAEDPRAGAVAP
jgi:hypothetical protein